MTVEDTKYQYVILARSKLNYLEDPLFVNVALNGGQDEFVKTYRAELAFDFRDIALSYVKRVLEKAHPDMEFYISVVDYSVTVAQSALLNHSQTQSA